MIVDSSAILAVVFGERAAVGLLRVIAESPSVGIGAPTLARVAREPLLCVGDDFPRTDIALVATVG